jgi:hypothetical protein
MEHFREARLITDSLNLGCDNCALHKSLSPSLASWMLRRGTMDRKKGIPAAWSQRRTRYDPPGLDEAIAAAQGLTDQIESQIAIAAQLVGLSEDEIRNRVLMAHAQANQSRSALTRGRQTEVVVIKRRSLRAN